ncbi:hypothetical protein GCM10027275_50260 [Rhabdobacter roseus]|uniref:Uncharacterized protein n=1 Tax=Rhabdobacter roseus TaxID=1655419 RepID=A0A840U439_9BACT|nr:hypothetical protein [Rhabdobacter roseus]MBB5287098.1 hypothetical protein [Rhabdobacter roseus]
MESNQLVHYLTTNVENLDNLEIYSIINCLNETEIEHLYFNYNLEYIIVNYITKYNKNHLRDYNNIILDLLQGFDRLSIQERKELRESLFTIAFSATLLTQIKIFEKLLNSDDAIENRRAAQLSKLIWNEDIQEKVINLYLKKYDKFIAIELINNLSKDILLNYFLILWNESFRDKEKEYMIEKTLPLNDTILDFLEQNNIKFYLLSILKLNIRLDEVAKLYPSIEYYERTYIKWITGKLQYKTLLLKLIELDKDSKTESFIF